jgi:aryl-alcohol dehydrogenase-like predicted oxidoreductase
MQRTQLATTRLGRTGLEITRVGFGAWTIGGGGWEFDLGPQDDLRSFEAINRALELGVNWIDTAAAYGFGHSEHLVGAALSRGARSTSARDAIDLHQIHWPVPAADIEEGWAALAELKERGLVRHIGVSNFDVEQLRRIRQIAPVETLQPPYSLVDRAVEHDILPFAEREGIGVIAYSPMGSGLLSGAMTRERIAALPDDDWRKHDERFTEPALSRHLATVARLETVAERHGTTAGAVAIAWTLANPAVDGAIVGFRRPEQVDPLVAAADLDLGPDDLAEIAAP